MMIRHISALIGLVILAGCASQPNRNAEIVQLKRQLMDLQKVQGQQAIVIDELGNKLLMIREKSTPVAENLILPTPAPVSGAERLYSIAVADSKKLMLDDLQKDVGLMIKGYKESPLTNNALYLLARTFYDRGQYAAAAQQYETLYKTYPDGNKAVSALYDLGLCYQKLGRKEEASEALHNVATLYPGSREAALSEKYLEAKESKQ